MSLLTRTRRGRQLGIVGDIAELALGTGGTLGLSRIEIGRRREPVKITSKLDFLKKRAAARIPKIDREREPVQRGETITLTLTRAEAELVLRALTGGGSQ